MHILLAPGALGRLTAGEVAAAMRAGWLDGAPSDEVTTVPLGDGGPGLIAAVQAVRTAALEVVTVPDPFGRPVPATLLVLREPAGADAPRTTVVVEAAQVLGGRPDGHAAGRGTSRGLGLLLAQALELAPDRLVVGIGGCRTHDAGTGLLAGLGLPAPVLTGGGSSLGDVRVDDLDGLAAMRTSLAGISIEVAVDVDVPLLGLHGASALLVPGLGVSQGDAHSLERGAGHLVHTVGRVLGPGAARALAAAPGAGAGGGLGFALGLLGARLRPGAEVLADLGGLDPAAARSELVLTAVPGLDPHTLHESVVVTAAARALAHGLPLVVVAGEVVAGRREWAAAGVSAAYALVDGPVAMAALLDGPGDVLAGALTARTARVARTWSR